MLSMAETRFGDFVTGFGLLFQVIDKWYGTEDDDTPMVFLNNSDNDKFTWMTAEAFESNFDRVGKL